MYKVHNNLSPPYLQWIFTNISSVHSRNLRNTQSNCYIPKPRTEYAKGFLLYRVSVPWNNIPFEIRQRPNYRIFSANFVLHFILLIPQLGSYWNLGLIRTISV